MKKTSSELYSIYLQANLISLTTNYNQYEN